VVCRFLYRDLAFGLALGDDTERSCVGFRPVDFDFGTFDFEFLVVASGVDPCFHWLVQRHCIFHFMADAEVASILPPNKSPEPTAVGACSSAVAVHVANRRWLSFFR
jgi:hypothetical protein